MLNHMGAHKRWKNAEEFPKDVDGPEESGSYW